jgi:hypothetical protein
VAVGGAGFIAGFKYQSYQQAKTKAAVQDVLKAIQAAPVVAEASK